MGVRVNKVVGYGLTNINVRKYTDRINDADALTANQWMGWCAANEEAILSLATSLPSTVAQRSPLVRIAVQKMYLTSEMVLLRDASEEGGRQFSLPRSFHYNPMSGKPRTLVLVPSSYATEWAQHDRMVDHLEEQERGKRGPTERVVKLTQGVYPHDRGETPTTVAALLLWLGAPELWEKLGEMLYVYWC